MVTLVLFVPAFVLASTFEVFDRLSEFSREHENWQLDEIYFLIMFSGIALAVFSLRRWSDLVQENKTRERAEEELRESEERYRTVIEQSAENIFLVDIETMCIIESNASFQKLIGYDAEEIKGMQLYQIVAHDPESVDYYGRLTLETGNYFVGNRRYRTKDGTLLDIEASISIVHYGAEKVYCVVSRDVTERIKAEEELRRSEERFRTLSDQAADALYVYDLRGKIVDVNRRACEVLGYTREELLSMSVQDLEESFDPETLVEAWSEISEGETFNIEGSHQRKDGTLIPVEVRVGIFERGGRDLMLAAARDVTERREAEQRMRWLASFPEQNPNLVIEADLSGNLTYANPEAKKRFPDLVAAGAQHPILEGFEALVRSLNKTGEDTLDRSVEIEGRTYYRNVSYIPESDMVRIYVSDITRRRTAEAKLVEAQRIARLGSWEAEPVRRETPLEERAMSWSDEMYEILGLSPQEVVPSARLLVEAVHPEERRDVYKIIRESVVEGERLLTFENRILRADGEERFVQARLKIHYDEIEELVRSSGTVLDITERWRVEKELRRSERSLAEAQRIAHVGNWEFDVQENKTYWSEETFKIFGLSSEHFVPSYGNFLKFVHPKDKEFVRSMIREALYEVQRNSFDHRIVRRDGMVRYIHTEYEVSRDDEGNAVSMVGTLHDVTERQKLEEELEHRAFHDSLTGLPNRALFMDRLRHTLRHSPGEAEEIVVLFLNVDNFKVINESLGHDAGDQLILSVSETLQESLNPEDTVARFGGDEFCILLEHDRGAEGALKLASQIASQLQRPQILAGQEIPVSASLGIFAGSSEDHEADDFIRNADLAMNRAKSKGKGRYEVFDPTMNSRAMERLKLENELRRALREEEFEVHYQPSVSLQSGEMTGVEALVRWRHPARGLMPPDEFIPLAEETGLIVSLGRWVLEEACRQVKEWQEEHLYALPMRLSVNLSPGQFNNPSLLKEISEAIEETGFPPRCLELEITESAMMEDEGIVISTLEELRSWGVRIAMDDFGTGYSSLSYLKNFPVDTLKIDKSFVDRIGEGIEDTAILQTVCDLGHVLGMQVVAEGIESMEHLELLQDMGYDLGQGYYFSKPLPGDSIIDLYRSPQRDWMRLAR